MTFGSTSWVNETPELSPEELKQLSAALQCSLSDEQCAELQTCFKALKWDGFDKHAFKWSTVRPEYEKLIETLKRFDRDFGEFSKARYPSAKGQAASLSSDPVFEWIEEPHYNAANYAPDHTELSKCIGLYLQRAEKQFEIQKSEAGGRPADDNFGGLIWNLLEFLNTHGLKARICTNREDNALQSDFWEAVVNIASRIRNKNNAGHNSLQSALLFIKRASKRLKSKQTAG